MDSNNPLSRLEKQVDAGNFSGATKAAQELLKNSDDEVDLVKCGKLLESIHEIELASLAYGKALKLAPEFSPAHSALGLLALAEGDNEQAVDHLQQAVRFEPRDAGMLTLLGVAHSNLGDKHEATRYIRQALQIEPSYEEANYNLGLILRDSLGLRRPIVQVDPAPRFRSSGT